jgi:hypothetical protein
LCSNTHQAAGTELAAMPPRVEPAPSCQSPSRYL